MASGSPRRKELLKFVIPEYSVVTADIEEACPAGISPQDRPEYLALQKAKSVAKSHPESIVIGADTAVFLNENMLGKPTDETEAFKMLISLSGKTHTVITGCAVVSGEKSIAFSAKSLVTFYDLTEKEISDYILTKEPLDKAGAYGIQGYGSLLVKEIKGDYFNIVGLPVAKLKRKLSVFLQNKY